MSSSLYYRGDTILLYVKFLNQEGKIPTQVLSPKVKVIHEHNGQLVRDLDSDLMHLSSNEYFYSLELPYDSNYGYREVIYTGEVDGKDAAVVEGFHIIPNPVANENVIKIFGLVHQLRAGYPLIGTTVRVTDKDKNEIFSESFTKDDGSWECFLYPGDYCFTFMKAGFKNQEISAFVGDENTEMKFANVALEPFSDTNKGHGVYSIGDKYQTKYGAPLNGLKVEAYSVLDLAAGPVAEDKTNDDGEWKIFLDPGIYLLKINGKSMEEEYNYTFRLKINDNGESQFEDLSTNIAVASEERFVDQGDGSVTVTDFIADANGNPIIDVQVNVFIPSDMNTIIAQDYTDVNGKWILKLDPGQYVFEYFHPEFNVVTEEKTIQ